MASLQRLLLFIASLLGCFPLHIPIFSDTPYFLLETGLNWRRPITWYNLLLLLFSLLTTVDFRGVPTFSEVKSIKHFSPGEIITGYVDNLNNLVSDRTIRLYYFFAAPVMLKILGRLEKLKLMLEETEKDSCNKLQKKPASSPGLLGGSLTNSKFFAFKSLILRLKARLEAKLSDDFVTIKVILFIHGINQFLNHLSLLQKMMHLQSREQIFVSQLRFGYSYSWIPGAVVYSMNNLLMPFSQFVCQALPICIIGEIVGLYGRIKDVLISNLHVSKKADKNGRDKEVGEEDMRGRRIRDDLIYQFKELKSIAESLSSVLSVQIIISLAAKILALGQFAYLAAMGTDALYFSRFISCGMGVYCILMAGDRATERTERGGKEIQDALMTTSTDQLNEELKEVALWASEWTYIVKAGNIITISMRLIPGILGTMMTYVIFLFQLNLSGDSTNF